MLLIATPIPNSSRGRLSGIGANSQERDARISTGIDVHSSCNHAGAFESVIRAAREIETIQREASIDGLRSRNPNSLVIQL